MRWNYIRTWMLALGMAAAASFPGLAAENGLDVSNLTWDGPARRMPPAMRCVSI